MRKLVRDIPMRTFDLRPAWNHQNAWSPPSRSTKQTSAYGHFGRTDVDLPWEHLDKVEDLKKYLA